MITIPDAMRRPAEVECDELKKQLAEARAEIEILKNQLEDESMRADGMTTAHAEAGADSYRMRELIEQMRGVITEALAEEQCPAKEYWQTVETKHHRGECWHAKARAALSAAEKGRVMITIPDAMRRPAEVERDELRKQLSEARAENAKLRKLLATRIEATRLDEAVDQLADARAEIERLQTELRQIADSCAETNLEIDWCKACTSRKWCAAGQSLVEAAERGEVI